MASFSLWGLTYLPSPLKRPLVSLRCSHVPCPPCLCQALAGLTTASSLLLGCPGTASGMAGIVKLGSDKGFRESCTDVIFVQISFHLSISHPWGGNTRLTSLSWGTSDLLYPWLLDHHWVCVRFLLCQGHIRGHFAPHPTSSPCLPARIPFLSVLSLSQSPFPIHTLLCS